MRRRFVMLALAACAPLLGCELLAGIDDRHASLANTGGAGGAGGSSQGGAGPGGGSGGDAGGCPPCPEATPICRAGACLAVDQLATGLAWHHTCAVLSDRTVRCWGKNDRGQVGVPPNDDRDAIELLPVDVALPSGVEEVSLGVDSSCARLATGSILCWGRNDYGQLGDGAQGIDRWEPEPVEGIVNAMQVDSGFDHSCALLGDGTVKCWGRNHRGQLGTGDTSQRDTPAAVVGLTGAVELALGERHSCARLGDGTVRCWGHGGSGELGDGNEDDEHLETSFVTVIVPPSAPLTDVVDIDLGSFHSCARRRDSTVWCWGHNEEGQLGDGTLDNRPWPEPVASLAGADALGAGYRQTCARKDGEVWCVGGSLNGDLGNGQAGAGEYITSADQVHQVDDAIALSTLFHHSCVRRRSGRVSCWGFNGDGQLGTGNQNSPKAEPVDVIW